MSIVAHSANVLSTDHVRAWRRTAFLILFLAILSSTAAPQVVSNVSIQASDGIHLDATITLPAGSPPPGGFPGIVLVHGFGGNKNDMSLYALLVTSYGYASIAYSVRGQGSSEGLSTIGGDRERQDLQEVIQYFRASANINPNKIGVVGGSQGGIHSWLAAAHRMPGVRAVAPLFATPDYATALTPNGCVKYGLVRELNLATVRYSVDRDRIHTFIVADQYDSVLQYTSSRDLAHLVDSIQIPVLQALGWADYLFPVNGGIRAWEQLVSRNIPCWSYYGTNGHDEVINIPEASYMFDILVRWFGHWFNDIPLTADSVSLVMYSDDRPNWPHHSTTTWPPQPSTVLRLYFTQNGLSESPPTGPAAFPFSLEYDPAYTAAMGWDDRYGGPAFLNAFNSTSGRLTSDALRSTIEVTGIPDGTIIVKSDAAKFQAHVRLYDVVDTDTGMVWQLISRAVNGIRNNVPGEERELAVEGNALSHIVPAGHRIGAEITSLDLLNDGQANIIPYFVSTHSQLLSTPSSRSYIDLPVVYGTSADVADHTPPPAGFSLAQNYPNPFNPSTLISYSVPSSAGGTATSGRQLSAMNHVLLTVYDVLGREVATLVNDMKMPGTYSAPWDAHDLASGIYFYRLQAGPYVATKRMILLK